MSESVRSHLGAFFLCNDVKIDWAYSFLASFREYNPTLPLTLIPYDDRLDQLRQLQSRFAFDILDYRQVEKYAGLGLSVPGQCNQFMQKLAAFAGPYDHFFYMDSDIIVTCDLTSVAQQNIASGYDLVYFERDIDYVYAPGPFRDEMVTRYKTHAFNAGCWFSRRNLFTWEEMTALSRQAHPNREAMLLGDQGLFNYYCDISGVKSIILTDLMPEFFRETWYRHVHPRKVDGRWIESQGARAGAPISLIHYAGQSVPHLRMANSAIYLVYRKKALAG